jgi:chromosome segregation ATPase
LFKQVISVAINFNKPFLSLSAGDKRTIVERIFNIRIFGDMLKIQKKKNADDKLQSELIKKEFMIHEENMKVSRKKLIELTEAEKNFNQNKKIEIDGIEAELVSSCEEQKTHTDQLKKYNNEFDSVKKNIKISGNDSTEFKKQRDVINKNLNSLEYQIKTDKNIITSFGSMSICPTCNNEITEEHKNKEVTNLQTSITKNELTISTFKKELELINSNISSIETNKSSSNELQNIISRVTDKILFCDKTILSLRSRIDEVKNRSFTIDLVKMNNEFEADKLK